MSGVWKAPRAWKLAMHGCAPIISQPDAAE
jgi:hypothetical protein